MWKKLQINTGDIFNRLTIIEQVENKGKHRYFNCKCECWNTKVIIMDSLIYWRTKSCWCYNMEILTSKGRNIKHWMAKTAIYNVYREMLQRCNNVNNKRYKNYWWRWIKCKWGTFEEFYKDMWEEYKLHKLNNNSTTIERNNTNWNYNKSNCRWATQKEQQNNRTNNIKKA